MDSNDAVQDISINDELRDLGVTKFVKQGDLVQIIIDRQKVVSFNIHPKEFQQTMDRFRKSAVNGTAGLSKETVNKMELILVHPDNGYINYLQLGNGKTEENSSGSGPESEFSDDIHAIYATVYYWENKLCEAAIIEGFPCFLEVEHPSENTSNKDKDTAVQINIKTEIPLIENDVLIPLPFNSYISRPYVFRSQKEFNKLVEKVRHETLDSLYQKVKTQWNLYIDNGVEHNIMCTGDTIFTYFQDKLGMTHYDFFVGGNGTGKSNNLHMFNLLAYRNVLSSDMPAPNMYQLLGSDKHGVVTMCEDEADNIDEDREKMRIYKDGFTTSIPVLRTDTSFGRKQYKFNTFCFKACAAEHLPDVIKGKGLLQRYVIYECTYGSPRYDISEVIEPGGDKKLRRLLDDLFELRNMLLIYRLLHYYDEIPNVELNIQNREKQLFKPTFRVFQNSGKALEELKIGISKYLTDYRKRRSNTFHAILYRVVMELIKREKSTEIKSTLIWTKLKDELQGKNILNKSMSFECEDFGTVVQGSVTKALREVFGAEKKRHGKSGDRYLKFDLKNLNKLSKIYDLPTEIKVTSVGVKNNRQGKRKSRLTDLTVLTVPRGANGAFSKSKKKNLRGNQAQNSIKRAKNIVKNRPVPSHVVSALSAVSAKEKGVN